MHESRRKEISIQADRIRQQCKTGRYGIIDLFKDCDQLGYKLIRYPLGEDADLGFALKKDNDTIVFINSSSRLSREIFTLAHEIGHVKLHLDKQASFVDNQLTINGRSEDQKEIEANYFAACLLMPSDEVEHYIDLELSIGDGTGWSAIDIARMMSEFNVSYDMVLNRLDFLNKIDVNQRVLLDTEKNKQSVSHLLRSIGGKAKLNVPGNEIDIPYEYLDYAIYNYNHNAIPRETLQKVLDCYKIGMDDIGDKLISREAPDDESIDLEDLIGGIDC